MSQCKCTLRLLSWVKLCLQGLQESAATVQTSGGPGTALIESKDIQIGAGGSESDSNEPAMYGTKMPVEHCWQHAWPRMVRVQHVFNKQAASTNHIPGQSNSCLQQSLLQEAHTV